LGIISIDFTGGEPLLYPKLPLLIRKAHEMRFFTSLTTNGTLYLKHADALHGVVSALSFSLDGPDRLSHEKVRGIRCFNQAIRSILYARKLGEMVMLKTTVCNDTIDTIPALITLAQRLGVLIELNAEFSYFHNKQLQTQFIHQMFKWWKHPNVIISHAHLMFMKDSGNDVGHPKCRNGTKVIVLAPNNGIFYPCMHKVENVIPLQDGDLKKTLNSDKFQTEWIGRHEMCQFCTIPCYFEPTYYTTIDKYWILSLWARIGYIRKRLYLTLKNRCL
jgi:MoaA/NifB/PqqE/SkfB family radical SAM enzyme